MIDTKIKILFLVSILLNVLMFGIILGHVYHHFSDDYFEHKHMAMEIDRLPENVRQKILTSAQEVKRMNQSLDYKVDLAREDILDILNADSFDETAYQKQLHYIIAVRSEMLSNIGNAVRELANDLPPEQRAILGGIFNDRPRLFPRNRKS